MPAQLLEATLQHICSQGTPQLANRFLTAETCMFSTQRISTQGKAGTGRLPPDLAQGSKTSAFGHKAW